MKEKWKTFREWKKNPRHEGLFKLFCWFFFFGVIYIILVTDILEPDYQYVSSNNKKDEELTDNTIDNYGKISNYEYEYTISYDDDIVKISGIVYDGKDYFTIEGINYYDDGTLYLVDEENKQLIANPTIELPILLSEINRSSIYLWLSEADVTATLKYTDGSTLKTYVYAPTEEYKIEIDAFEKDYLIESLQINLLELLSTKGFQYNKFEIEINYKNINKISSYERNYDEYKIIDNNNLESTDESHEGEVV